eukprot:TRINITY_DN3351_c0_g1_i1.p1 TRINITY_DN3351_c0_g1~~TRINITY_DN3351_c0_g1_i1.p1  ORF type:complete len:311 (-),score=73.88 TRINITY_DN3351_c0_g1_i1:35-967(-)
MLLKNDFKNALQDCLVAVEKNPVMWVNYINASNCYIALGKLSKAEFILTGINDFAVCHRLAFVRSLRATLSAAIDHLASRQYSESKASALKVLEKSNDCFEAKIVLFDSFIGLGEIKEAKALSEVFRSTLVTSPGDCHCLRIIATILYYEGDFATALDFVHKASRLYPDDARTQALFKKIKNLQRLSDAGNDVFQMGDYATAAILWSEALSVDQFHFHSNKFLHLRRAEALVHLGKFEEAVMDCTAALSLSNNFRPALIFRGQCYLEMKQFLLALRDFERAWNVFSDGQALELIQHAKLMSNNTMIEWKS